MMRSILLYVAIIIAGCQLSTAEAQISRLDKRFNVKPKAVTKPMAHPTSTRKTPATKPATRPEIKPSSPVQQKPLYVTLDGLYNEEIIQLPTWFWEEVKDINENLKEKLSPSDYLEILKGEEEWYGVYKTRDEYYRELSIKQEDWAKDSETTCRIIYNLKDKLQKILDNPENDYVFSRPHFEKRNKTGIRYREYIRYSNDNFRFYDNNLCSDDDFILSRRDGYSFSSLWTFWNSRTGRIESQFNIPTYIYAPRCATRTQYGSVYVLNTETSSELSGNAHRWNGGVSGRYLIAPQKEIFQSFGYRGKNFGAERNQQPRFGALGNVCEEIPPDDVSDDQLKGRWYRHKDAGFEFIHMSRRTENGSEQRRNNYVDANNKSFVFYSKYEKGFELNWDAFRMADPQDNSMEKLRNRDNIEKKIWNCMTPIPRDFYGEIGCASYIGEGDNKSVLFTAGESPGATDPGGALIGLLVDGKVYFFPLNDQGDPFVENGKLEQYEKCIYLTKSGSKEAGEVREGYICTGDLFSTDYSSITLKDGSNEMEIALALSNWDKQVGFVRVLRVNLRDMSYYTRKNLAYNCTSILPPIWISEKSWFLRPESNYQYSIIVAKEGEAERKIGDFYVDAAQGYAIVLPDGRYMGSPGCESFLAYGDGERELGMKALAPWRNRPAEVLEALGGNPDDVEVLRETTKRWLTKQGFDPDNMPAEPSLNNFPVAEVKMPDLFSARERVSFQVKLKATAHGINKALVYADGVLIPQSWDESLDIAAGEEQTVTVEVPLASGQNWIEITPVDNEGISGDTTRFRTIYEGKYPSDLFIVALGVSDYDDPDLKLQYAAKDAKDIAAAFEKYGTGRKHMLVLTDKEVKDRSVLDKVKIFLSAASLEDRIVFYVAGHGMLDDKLNYYYAPAGFDAERIVETGIPMEELTACLRDSQARHRLLLLDTCHSGVLGEEGEDKLAMSGVQLPHGVRAIQHRGMKVKKAVGALNANQKKRYIEDMFSQGDTERGINIIAGAAGAEYALESDSWNNGVFTASVISALSGEDAVRDLDDDGFFSVEELQQRISTAVQQQTGGRQKPSIVSAEGAENMVLVEGVNSKIKPLIEKESWDELEEAIKRSPRNYEAGQSEELLQELIKKNAPLRLVKLMLEHGASPARQYTDVLAQLLRSDNDEYKSSIEEMVRLFAESGNIKEQHGPGYWSNYSPANHGEEKLVALLLEKGFLSFENPYGIDRSLELYRIFVQYGISPTYKIHRGTQDDVNEFDRFKQNILHDKIRREHRNNPQKMNAELAYTREAYQIDLMISPLHDLAFSFGSTAHHSQREEILDKMSLLLKNGADPNSLEGHREDGHVSDRASHMTPLYVLCRHPRISFREALPAIKLLLKHGADIHLADCNGREPLDSWDPNYQVLVQMAEAAKAGRSLDGYDSQVSDNTPAQNSYSQPSGDRSSLDPMIANMRALRCREEASKLYQKRLLTLLPMIRNGADVDVTLPETKGNTALHYAVAIGSWSITQWLVEHGANVNAVTNAGKTPLDCVGSDNAKRIRELLISRGARKSR